MRKKQNGDCNVGTFRRFHFGMSPDVPAFKVCVLTSDFKFRVEVNGCYQFAHSFDLTIFAKVLICSGWFLFGECYYITIQLTH